MPKLILLVACEKVILDKGTLPSLISIFQSMNIPLPDAPLPENAISPVRWSIFTMWRHPEEERGIEFTQHTEILKPDGQKFGDGAITKFIITAPNDFQSKNHIEVLGLPINDEGFIIVRVWLEGVANSEAEYQFRVRHIPKDSHGKINETPAAIN